MDISKVSRKCRNGILAILVNGRLTQNIPHVRGLRQGNPLSPLLFIIAIDPLQHIIEHAAQRGILHPVLPKATNLRCSLYADNEAIFANSNATELKNFHKILKFFGECSGLKINVQKTDIFLIRVEPDLIPSLIQNFPGKIGTFSGKYLGLPLHTMKLRKVEF